MDYKAIISKKIYSSKDDIEFSRLLAFWRFKDKKIVFTNGCFDILHRGHFEYLMQAASLGDVLIIGLNTDDSVKRLKGIHRPINNEESRAIALASLFFVHAVVLFSEDTPTELIKIVKPHILVKGGDYKANEIAGYDIVTQNGGKVEIIPFIDGYSSTKIIEQIQH
ncbi:MAG: D-glycero-beta-D-manno-heptose 1-phosphate adenylyltransferase [Bacteroidales bacterium]|nr:D-glycero-beta-D-manno-heptose 1-phosphate adenylyltransferase [Bacteroidales bacterium]